MKVIHTVELKPGSYEEQLPDFSPDFPYIASYVELEKHLGKQSPWHWHKEVELFYMKEGAVEYDTPQGRSSSHRAPPASSTPMYSTCRG